MNMMATMDSGLQPIVSGEEYLALTQFLYREARLLDQRDHNQWLTLLHDDFNYFIPLRHQREASFRKEDWSQSVDKELSGAGELSFTRNNKPMIMAKVMRFNSGLSFSENPASLTQRTISNIEVLGKTGTGDYQLRSNFTVTRRRFDKEDIFVGFRDDVVAFENGQLLLKDRRVVFNDSVLRSPNLSIFF